MKFQLRINIYPPSGSDKTRNIEITECFNACDMDKAVDIAVSMAGDATRSSNSRYYDFKGYDARATLFLFGGFGTVDRYVWRSDIVKLR